MTNHSLQSILAKSDLLGRLVKWAVELGEFDVSYHPKTAIKGQVLADLLADLADNNNKAPDVGLLVSHPDCAPLWQLWVDGPANKAGSGVGVVVTTPEGNDICGSVSFGF